MRPCDLSLRVSAVDFGIRYPAFSEVAIARIQSPAFNSPVVLYDAATDAPRGTAFTKSFGSSGPVMLEVLRTAICAGEVSFEVIGRTGATLAETRVMPSNTGKC